MNLDFRTWSKRDKHLAIIIILASTFFSIFMYFIVDDIEKYEIKQEDFRLYCKAYCVDNRLEYAGILNLDNCICKDCEYHTLLGEEYETCEPVEVKLERVEDK